MTPRRRALLLALLVAAPVALALAAGAGLDPLSGLLPPRATGLPTHPPSILVDQEDRAGTLGPVTVSGVATDDAAVLDVEVRLDRGAWTSVASAARGLPVALWSHTFEGVAPGVHVVEARAFDGATHSLPASFTFKAGETRRPPSVTVTTPDDGAGAAAGEPLRVAGTVVAEAPLARVVVRVDGRDAGEAVLAGGRVAATAWSLVVPGELLGAGAHVVEVVAEDERGGRDALSLPRTVDVATTRPGPAPAVRLLTPLDGAGVNGDLGSPDCVEVRPCLRVTGRLEDPASLATGLSVSVDGGAWRPLARYPGSEAKRLGSGTAFAFDLDLRDAYAGRHDVRVRADVAEGASVPATLSVNVASPRALVVEADPAAALPTGTRLAVLARWPDGANAVNASWTVDGREHAADGVGVLPLVFDRPGLHDVEALARDAEGRAARAVVTLAALNRAPVADFSAPATAGTNVSVGFDGSASSDPDGGVALWRWSFGDGAESDWTPEPKGAHVYRRPGAYVVNLTVRDGYGGESPAFSRVVVLGNSLPDATFFVSPESGVTVRTPVVFTDASLDPDGPIARREWDFGRGVNASTPVATHRFPTRGVHKVGLTVWDASNESATTWRDVLVENLPPEPRFLWDHPAPRAGQALRFLDRTTDPDGTPVAWSWSFGDGNASAAREPLHAYAASGNYTVILRVTDDAGAVASAARQVWVGNAPPLVNASVEPATPRSYDVVRLRPHVADVDGAVARIRWDLGDGQSVVCEPTACRYGSGPALPAAVPSRWGEIEHHFARPGAHEVRLAAWDDLGARAEHVFTVHVLNRPPTAAIVSPTTFAYAGVPTPLEGEAADLDGLVVDARWVIEGGLGDVTLQGSPVAHVFPEPGVYRLTFVAVDDAGAETSATRDLQVDVAPPGEYPPVVRVEFPRPDAVFSGTVRFTGTAASVAPLRAVEVSFWRDGRLASPFATPWQRADGRELWSLDLDSRVLENDAYEVVVRAVDARGAHGEVRVPVRVENVDHADAARIALQVTSLAPGDVVRGEHVVRGTAYHPEGLTGVRVRVDDGSWVDVVGPGASWAHAVRTTELKNGPHTLTVRAYRGPVLHRELAVPFEVDNHPPTLVVTRPMPRNATGVSTVEGHLGEGPEAQVFWRVDRLPWAPAEGGRDWRFRVDTRDLPNGEHELLVVARSVHGLESPGVTYVFGVENLGQSDVVTPRSRSTGERAVPAGDLALAALALVGAGLALARRR